MTNYNGTTGNDVFTGSTGNDTIVGNAGDDTLNGGAGYDLLVGGAGADVLDGGADDDRLFSGDESPPFSMPYYDVAYTPPVLDTGAEVDTLNGGDGTDRLFAGYGDNVDGGANGNIGDYLYISFMGASSGVTADFRQQTLVIGGGTITNVENLSWVQGSNFADDINAGAHDYSGYSDFTAVFGMGGDDRLVAGYYTGVLDGGDGEDFVDGRSSGYLQKVFGGAGDDTLYTALNSFAAAYGGDGDDTIYAHALTYGGAGDDVIVMTASAYARNVYGEAGDDQIQAGSAGNIISGGTGADLLNGDAGADTLIAADMSEYPNQLPSPDMGLEHDVLNGFGGNDSLSAGYGDDVDGGSGADTLYLSFGGLTSGAAFNTAGLILAISSVQPFALGGGTISNVETLAYLRGSEFGDILTIANQSTRLTVDAGAGDDVIISSDALVDALGGDGDDRFVAGTLADSFNGGAGLDTVDYGAFGVGVTVSLLNGLGANNHALAMVENVDGSAQNDVLNGDAGANRLRGMAGDDILNGAAGVDTLVGGLGDDTYYVDNSADVVIENAAEGVDSVFSSATYTLSANIEKLTLTGFAAINATGNSGANVIAGNAAINVLDGADGADTLIGGQGDTLIGGAGADTLDGTAGIVTASYANSVAAVGVILGGAVTGGDATGDTLISIENLTGSAFDDSLFGDGGANLISGGSGNDTLSGEGGDDEVRGGLGDDYLHGKDGNDTLDGGAGIDKLFGGLGDDIYIVDAAQDVIVEWAGEGTDVVLVSTTSGLSSYVLDRYATYDSSIESLSAASQSATTALDLTGNDFGQSVQGNAGVNRLSGLGGNDGLYGYAGDDILTGGSGTDLLTGGAGNDVFRDTVSGLSGDIIADLSLGDQIQFTDASLASFSFSLSGSTLTYTGGSVKLQALPNGYHLEASAAAQGVSLSLVRNQILNNGVSADFNGDGKDDLLWRSDAGQMSNWLGQANGGFVGNDANAFATVSTAWRIIGAGDFNGDGRDDILWRSDAGQMSNWLGQVNGGFIGNDANAFVNVPNDWQVSGVGDFNGDGKSDLLWRSNTGHVSDWLGQADGGFAGNDGNAFRTVGTDWHIVGVGDFNGDHRDDILWRSDAGQLSNWLGQANGGFAGNDGNAFVTVSTDWHVVGVGDFNGDGRSDILWRSDAGQMSNWLGTASGGWSGNDANAFTTVSNDWVIAGVGDFNGDGRDDVVWRNTTNGAMSNWLGKTNGGFTGNDTNAYQVVDPSWHIQVHDLFAI